MGKPEAYHTSFEQENFKDAPPPPYEISFENSVTTALQENGRFTMNFAPDSKLLQSLPPLPTQDQPETPWSRSFEESRSFPVLNIVMQVVGSRGDVQPFIALGVELLRVGHRVRLATHDTFRDFVTKSGLEFFPIGGDPAELMAYMVKNPGVIPTLETLRGGEIPKKRKMVKEMLKGCWRSCIEPDPITNIPFVAEAIIANPPSFAHVHCAQALGIPVHLMFTMPWTATRSFPHPLANIQATDADPSIVNYLSYGMVDVMTWQGLGDLINGFRRDTLDLEKVPAMFDSNLVQTGKVPFTYCWSPALIPKPTDWPSTIDVCGFFFRTPPSYEPPPDIDEFLRAGSKPIYIGFGSIVMEDAQTMTQNIIAAIEECGVRAIVSKGWSKLGGGLEHEKILFIDDCPHEWLFQHVSAVIHHGGAGTTACGLLNGLPTGIVPFFGDQPFWANMVAAAGAGPPPIDIKLLNPAMLSSAIQTLLSPATVVAARAISHKMQTEEGVRTAVASFHRHLNVKDLSCDIVPGHVATWAVKGSKKGKERAVILSHRAASVLVEKKKIHAKHLRLHKSKPIHYKITRWEPITAILSASLDSALDIGSSIGNLASNPVKEYRKEKSRAIRSRIAGSDRGTEDISPVPSIASGSTSTTLLQITVPDDQGALSKHSIDEAQEKEGESNSECTHGEIESRQLVLADQGPRETRDKSQDSRGAGHAASRALGRGLGRVGNSFVKTAIDIPLALSEGLAAVPKLYGNKVRDVGPVSGWKSGTKAGMRSFGYGMYDGYVGLFTETYKGIRDHGAPGLLSGFAKGYAGFVTQPGSAVLGLVSYPALGLYRSLNTRYSTGAQGAILRAQKAYGQLLAEKNPVVEEEASQLVQMFDMATKGQVFDHDDEELSEEIPVDESQYTTLRETSSIRSSGRVIEKDRYQRSTPGSSPERGRSLNPRSTAVSYSSSLRAQPWSIRSVDQEDFDQTEHDHAALTEFSKRDNATDRQSPFREYSDSRRLENISGTISQVPKSTGRFFPANEKPSLSHRDSFQSIRSTPSFLPDTAHHGPELGPHNQSMYNQKSLTYPTSSEGSTQYCQPYRLAELSAVPEKTANFVPSASPPPYEESPISEREAGELDQAIRESIASNNETHHNSTDTENALNVALRESMRLETEREAVEKQELDEAIRRSMNVASNSPQYH
ncbi:UDP-Glycosyltransferase/glycogen phosphorylase [Glarea lozoyensis ATCC 20868]|uniref:UDP-Glycosyltransferase/glycogen phosphorylase n=1 Tax=Glarea lozoyensis (strain ATCC 20868 / MF5171) TaxID=1116229 RepID=S3D0X2_GLAL2|nr:UDP-Glycosyltransferase/glycogen phosphorylase [Glarea lozoyensis ATCC 20868]EPE31505.1 UDP-Glycosyltransferase/glycogen phosphorylase [Glarea lozoyensis ATCC 20868]